MSKLATKTTEPDYQLQAEDRQIILASQAGLPLVAQPYHQLAQELGMDVDDVMLRIRRMLDSGVIRRIGSVPNHYKLGFRGNGMTVWDVADERIKEIGQRIGELDNVSHCYHRPRYLPDWPYNLFAMVHGRERNEVMQQAEQIAQMLGTDVRAHDVLFSTRILKKTGLRLQAGN